MFFVDIYANSRFSRRIPTGLSSAIGLSSSVILWGTSSRAAGSSTLGGAAAVIWPATAVVGVAVGGFWIGQKVAEITPIDEWVADAISIGLEAIKNPFRRHKCLSLYRRMKNACNGAGNCNSHMCCLELSVRLTKALSCHRLRTQITTECYSGLTDSGHAWQVVQALAGIRECKEWMKTKCSHQPEWRPN